MVRANAVADDNPSNMEDLEGLEWVYDLANNNNNILLIFLIKDTYIISWNHKYIKP